MRAVSSLGRYNRGAVTLSRGSRVGPYEVIAQIGVGGMGEVYRATDTNLKRDVAIKVLSADVAGDSDRLARFHREAEVLAALNHPNIAAIHGLEMAGDITAIVMEFVEGPTLADHIARGVIPVDEASLIAKQIAEALEAAHERGIIHRDLKPANIKVRRDGTVKVLDFGLAKAMDVGREAPAFAGTITTPAITQTGVILGTAAYMAPEQTRGTVVDKRADLWAFGVVFYEMLTGTRPFEGATLSDTVAAVLRQEPDWRRLPADTPSPIRRLLRRCLEKDRKQRLPDAAMVRLEIDDAVTSPGSDAPTDARTTASSRATQLAWLMAAVATVGAAAFALPAIRHLRETGSIAPSETRVDIVTPATGDATSDPLSFALSPDGRQIVFVASDSGTSRLWLRSLDSATARPLAGTDGAAFPFWAPNNKSVGFFSGDQLKLLDLTGGTPRTLTAGVEGRGGTWNADGLIVFAPGRNSPLSRIPAAGGSAVPVTTLDRQISHRFPVFLPDGRHFLFYAQGKPETTGIHLASLDGGTPTRLVPAADSAGVLLQSGPGHNWLIWVRRGALMTQRLDVEHLALSGELLTLADPVEVSGEGGFSLGAVSVSATGLIAYRAHAATRRHQLTWVGRTGKVLGRLGEPSDGELNAPALSSDNRRAVVSRIVQGSQSIWIMDGVRTSRLTFAAGHDRRPLWSPDGRRIVFDSDRTGVRNLYLMPANGAEPESVLIESTNTTQANDWSTDGRFLLYHVEDPKSAGDLWVQPMDPTGSRPTAARPWVILQTPFDERWGRLSPDGRWLAYQSDESGRAEIYVRSFPPAGSTSTSTSAGVRWPVSTAGGLYPMWRADGRELYYLGANDTVMAASISVQGSTIEPGAPVPLFPARIFTGTGREGPQFDVTRDGRFLFNAVLDDAVTVPITIIQNWRPEERK
jgi:eukaryotic-like serine/threonine-protein kinase